MTGNGIHHKPGGKSAGCNLTSNGSSSGTVCLSPLPSSKSRADGAGPGGGTGLGPDERRQVLGGRYWGQGLVMATGLLAAVVLRVSAPAGAGFGRPALAPTHPARDHHGNRAPVGPTATIAAAVATPSVTNTASIDTDCSQRMHLRHLCGTLSPARKQRQ